MTGRVYADEFLAYLKCERGYSINTIKTYRIYLNEFLSYLKSQQINLDEADHRNVRGFLFTIQNMSKSSRTLIVSIIRSFFKFCMKRKYLDDNPAAIVATPKFNQPLPKFLSEKEAEKFCQLPILILRDKAILEVLYGSGIRVAELTGITIEDIDFEKRIIRIKGKGHRERLALYSGQAARALNHYLHVRPMLMKAGSGEAALFVNYKGGRLSERQVQRIIEKYWFISELDNKITPHSLRHSFASHLMAKGCGIVEIMELLGHVSLATTEKYLHTNVANLREVYKKAMSLIEEERSA